MYCCGQRRNDNYCSRCGKELVEDEYDVIDAIIAHLETIIKQKTSHRDGVHDRMQRQIRSPGSFHKKGMNAEQVNLDIKVHYGKMSANVQRSIDKYTEWIAAIKELKRKAKVSDTVFGQPPKER